MDIRINSRPVNFSLEDEKSVAEVIASVSGWARERELVFTEARINDEPYMIESLPDMSLDSVRSIDCIVQSRADVVISSWRRATLIATGDSFVRVRSRRGRGSGCGGIARGRCRMAGEVRHHTLRFWGAPKR